MWIILLDHSGSMGEPFTGATDGKSRRLREMEAEIKLVAAKEVILEELRELGADVPVAIFGFTEKVELIFDPKAHRRDEVEAKLGLVEASDGTDIAAALNAAADYMEREGGRGIPRIVLISDGQSDRAQAMLAARRCAGLSIGIHFILIDPTEDGEAFRREVVRPVGGTSETVTSRSQLKETADQARTQYHQDQAKAEQFLKAAENDAETIRQETSDRERIEFTSGYPGRIRQDAVYPVIVYVHLAAMRQEVEERLAKTSSIFGEYPKKSETQINQLFPIGTNLEITPRINNLAVNPAQQSLTWLGEIAEASFRVQYAGPADASAICSGFIDVTTSGLLIAQIPVSVSMGADREPFSWERKNGEMIRRIFASYAREDSPIVEACRAAYRGLGIQLFMDKDDLLAGQAWKEVIRRNISNHDLFQLFWSKLAADSSEVSNEWHLALEIAPQRKCDFVRPVYWSEPVADLPGELKHLNFGFLDLRAFKLKSEPDVKAPVDRAFKQIEAKFPILEVVPCDAAAVEGFRKDLSTVVPFLEHIIGIRYYPPVTFLVDEHAVQMLRSITTPAEKANEDQDRDDESTRHVIELLKSLGLAFHVGKLAPNGGSFSERNHFYDAVEEQAKEDFFHIIRMTEHGLFDLAKRFLSGERVWEEGRRSLKEVLSEVSRKQRSGWEVENMIAQLCNVASPADKLALAQMVSDEDRKGLKEFDKEKAATAAQNLLSTKVPELASKYRIELFFGSREMTELRLKTTFAEYVQDFCRKWLSYVDVALRKLGNVPIDFGCPISAAELDWLEEVARVGVRRREYKSLWGSAKDECLFEMDLQDYRFCLDLLSKRLVERLAKGAQAIGQILFPVIASTYGVFVPGTAASAQTQFEATLVKSKWPRQAALDGQDKVLICLGAIDRLKGEMQQTSRDKAKADDLSRRFALAVLVHEHFHAALATGVDRNGHSPLGVQRLDEWDGATNLNESLAAWVERHFFRNDPEMLEHIDAYIRSGDYPVWPYRGAEKLEGQYEQGGLPTVRRWIQYMRDDPVNAQKEFDKL